MKARKLQLTTESRRSWAGVSFVAPWILGFLCLYAWPLVQSLIFCFTNAHLDKNGDFVQPWVGLENFKHVFMVDPNYTISLTDSLKAMAMDIPSILVFSLLISLILNQNFRGRVLARAVFFLPVIIASGIVINIMNGDIGSAMMQSGEKSSGGSMFQVAMFKDMLMEVGLSEEIVNFITDSANNVFELSWRSGVQILLLLSGLQSIPVSLYEAADIDGCTAWERFWKITFPMLSSILLVCLVYSITDIFTSYDNGTMRMILDAGQNLDFSYAATMAWVYFAIIAIVLGAIILLTRKHITYLD